MGNMGGGEGIAFRKRWFPYYILQDCGETLYCPGGGFASAKGNWNRETEPKQKSPSPICHLDEKVLDGARGGGGEASLRCENAGSSRTSAMTQQIYSYFIFVAILIYI